MGAAHTMQDHEPLAILVDNAETGTTTVAAKASAATHGIKVPGPKRRSRVHLEIRKAVASGTPTFGVRVFGYRTKLVTQTENNNGDRPTYADVASSGAWYELFDTGTVTAAGTGENFSYLLDGATDFDRLATVIDANGGSTATITTAFAFGGLD